MMGVTFRHAELANGLTIVAEVDADAHTAAAGFFVKTGARDEESGVMGVSHFLEHMMFKGTERRSANDVNREFDEIGASYNAYTSAEITCFYASVLPERLGSAVDILSDILRPSLRQEDFDQEKNVILEEIAMYKDNPFWVLYEELMARHYGAHAMAHRVLGFDTTVTDLKRDEMASYFGDRYSADNTVVSLAGRIDFDAAVAQIGEACGSWERTGAKRDAGVPATGAPDFTLRDENVTRAYLMMLSGAPAMSDKRRYAATMLAKALGDHDNSRLHWALVETGIAEEAEAGYEPHDGCGDYYVFASCPKERVDEVWEVAQREMDGVAEGVTDRDLEMLRNKLATGVTVGGERPGGRMQRLGKLWTYLGEYVTLEDELAAIAAVTPADVRAVYGAYPFSPRTVGRLLPGE